MKLISPVFCTLVVALAVLAATSAARSQEGPTIRQLFESGKYPEVTARANEAGGDPEDTYLLAQTYVKLQNGELAKQTLDRLVQRGENDPWALVARSERARIDQNTDEALALAQAAVALAPPPPASAYVQYQLGLVQSQRQNMQAAADAFEKAAAAMPTFAYAHYYAGMAFSSLQRIDRVASHFETFLKLAPAAPERGAVESIMRTIRGK